MRKALQQAKKGLGRTSPNPVVGAVVVREGKIIAKGYHIKSGDRHAEEVALGRLDGKARRGDALYVTLEPCNHYGKTPPCTEAILKNGVRKVVVGTKDPNPSVSGGGCEFLIKNDVEVKTGLAPGTEIKNIAVIEDPAIPVPTDSFILTATAYIGDGICYASAGADMSACETAGAFTNFTLDGSGSGRPGSNAAMLRGPDRGRRTGFRRRHTDD